MPLAPAQPQQEIRYVTHASAHRDNLFVQGELTDKTRCVHIIVLPLYLVANLPNLCLSPVKFTPQEGCRPRFI